MTNEVKINRLKLRHGVVDVELNKVETDDEKAELWEIDEDNTVNTKVTFAMKNITIPVEAIYEKENNNLLLFNINIDEMCSHTKLIVDYTVEGEELTAVAELKNIEEAFKILGIPRIDTDGNKVFATPTYMFEDEHGNTGKVILWLNDYGHRTNQLHLSFI